MKNEKPKRLTLPQIRVLCTETEQKMLAALKAEEHAEKLGIWARNGVARAAWVDKICRPEVEDVVREWLVGGLARDTPCFNEEPMSDYAEKRAGVGTMMSDLKIALTMEPTSDWKEVLQNLRDIRAFETKEVLK